MKTTATITLSVLVIILSLALTGAYQKEKAQNQEIATLQNTADRSLDTLNALAEQSCLNEDQRGILYFSEIPEKEKAPIWKMAGQNRETCEKKEKTALFYVAVGKIESDSDYCLNNAEIEAIKNAPVIDEYKNYLFESDARTRANAEKMGRNMINCE